MRAAKARASAAMIRTPHPLGGVGQRDRPRIENKIGKAQEAERTSILVHCRSLLLQQISGRRAAWLLTAMIELGSVLGLGCLPDVFAFANKPYITMASYAGKHAIGEATKDSWNVLKQGSWKGSEHCCG